MKDPKMIIAIVLLILIVAMAATGCTRYDAVRFVVQATGETIDVGLARGDDYTLSYKEDGSFDVSKDGNVLSNGMLLAPQQMSEISEGIESGRFECLETGKKDNIDYKYIKYTLLGHDSYAYIGTIDNAQAGILVSFSDIEEAERETIFGAINVRIVSVQAPTT